MTVLEYVWTGSASIAMSIATHIRSGGEFLIGRCRPWGDDSNLTGELDADPIFSISGIAIGPGSDVDRVIAQYSLPLGITKNAISTQMTQVVAVTVNKPLIGSLLAPGLKLNATASLSMGKSWVTYYIGTRYLDYYYKEGTPGQSVFGSGMPNNCFIPPELEVVLATGSERLNAAWSGPRAVKVFNDSQPALTLTTGTELPILCVPTYGRNRAVVTAHGTIDATSPPTTPDVFGIRVAGVYSSSAFAMYERQIAPGAYPTVTTFVAPGQATFDLDLKRLCSFLIIYITKLQQGANQSTAQVNVALHDE